jgi:hypothetical protein
MGALVNILEHLKTENIGKLLGTFGNTPEILGTLGSFRELLEILEIFANFGFFWLLWDVVETIEFKNK